MFPFLRKHVVAPKALKKKRRQGRTQLRIEQLESRRVLALVISEVHVSPLFGSNDTDQYIELRGTPNATLPNGSYFVTLEGWGAVPGGPGYIHSAINLSGLKFGSNGFLVIAEHGHPYQVDPSATLLVSTAPGFSGLPNNRWSDASSQSDRLAFIFNAGTFLLIQSPTAPVPASDADANDDGTLDGDAASWNVIDSVGLLNSTASPSRSYGKITFSSKANNLFADGTEMVVSQDGGYVGRIGASSLWRAKDWVMGQTIDGDKTSVTQYRFTVGGLGDPRPLEYAGRNLNHVGTYNFDGGSVGKVLLDADGDKTVSPGDTPLSNIQVFADANQNRVRDDVTVSILASDYDPGTEHTNRFPNATLTVTDENNNNLGFIVRTNLSGVRRVFSSEGIPWYDPQNRLKVTFYQEANFVSTQAIAAELLKDSYARLEVYNRNNQLLEFVQSGAMRKPEQQTLEIRRNQADIKYAIIYTNSNFLQSSPFGPFDELSYSYPEFATTTDSQGNYDLEQLPAGSYNIRAVGGPAGKVVVAGTNDSYPLTVTNSDHQINADFLYRDNLPPAIDTTELLIEENPALNSVVGKILATDPDPGQALTFQILSNSSPFAIDPQTGDIKVASSFPWNFENTPPLVVQIKVTDNMTVPASTIRSVTFTPSDINESPVISLSEFTIAENSSNGTFIGDVVATDEDAGNNGELTYAIGPDGPSGIFTIDPDTGRLSVLDSTQVDFETNPVWSIPILVTDKAATPLSALEPITVRLINVNEAPRNITFSDTIKVPESVATFISTNVATIQVIDDALGTNTLSLSGPDRSFFTIVNGKLQFKTETPLDFETKSTYTVAVNADDPTLGATPDVSVNFVLNISDVNEAPTGIGLTDIAQVFENTPNNQGFRAATVQVFDDALGNNTLTVSGPDASRFEIVGNELRFKANTPLNFENQSRYEITINVDDPLVGPSPDAAHDFTISIVDVNEPPTAVTLNVLTPNIDEAIEPSLGFAVADIRVLDDALGVNTFVLSGNDADTFEVVGNQLRVKAGVVFDFEDQSSYEVKVQAVDASLGGAPFPEATNQLLVRNLPEVTSITDVLNNPLTSEVRKLRVHWDSVVDVFPGAIRVLKTDIGGVPVTTSFVTSVVGSHTVADVSFSGPFTHANGLIDGDFVVRVDGIRVQAPSTLLNGVNHVSEKIHVANPAPLGKLELSGPATTFIDKVFAVHGELSGVGGVPSDSYDYKLDWDNDGTVDRTETGPATFNLSGLSFPAGGSYTINVGAWKNGVLKAQGYFVIDVSPAAKAEENWLSAMDTDRDSTISPLDVLVVINRINSRVGSDPVPYLYSNDVDRDGSISPLDVLVLINYLNSDPNSRSQTFELLTMHDSGPVLGISNDNSITGKIVGTSRELFVTLDGQVTKDASRFVQADGTFTIQDAAIVQLFGSVAEGNHLISLKTRTGSEFSSAMDKRFHRKTFQSEFQIVSATSVSGGAKFQWTHSSNGSLYNVYASLNGAAPTKVGSLVVGNETTINLVAGVYDIYVEAVDAAGNSKRSPTVKVTI